MAALAVSKANPAILEMGADVTVIITRIEEDLPDGIEALLALADAERVNNVGLLVDDWR